MNTATIILDKFSPFLSIIDGDTLIATVIYDDGSTLQARVGENGRVEWFVGVVALSTGTAEGGSEA